MRRRTTILNRSSRVVSRLAVLVATVLLCEMTLSIASYASPRLRFHLTAPSSQGAISDALLGRRMSPFFPGHDRLGYRNETVPAQIDVLAVGDSLTYGYAAPPDGSWPYHLQQLSGRIVYNAGVGGYGPLEYAAVVDEMLHLRPETVVLGLYLGNDLLNAYLSVYVDRRFPQFATHEPRLREQLDAANRDMSSDLTRRITRLDRGPARERWLEKSSLYAAGRNFFYAIDDHADVGRFAGEADSDGQTFEAAIKRPGRIPYDRESEFRTVFRDPGFLAVSVDDSDPRLRDGDRITREVLLGISDLLRRKQVRLIVVLLPFKPTVYAGRIEDRRASGLPSAFFSLAELEKTHTRRFADFLMANRVEVVDAATAMDRAFARRKHPYPESEDDHPNTNGYRAIAETILPALVSTSR